VGAWRRDPQFRTLLVLVLFTLLTGTIFYNLEEGWSIVDALYFSVTTLTTVGLGDLSPTTTLGKLFTIIHIFAGLSLVLGFIDTVAKETFRSRTRGRGRGEDLAARSSDVADHTLRLSLKTAKHGSTASPSSASLPRG
jgi:voltage-gated potassium channel